MPSGYLPNTSGSWVGRMCLPSRRSFRSPDMVSDMLSKNPGGICFSIFMATFIAASPQMIAVPDEVET